MHASASQAVEVYQYPRPGFLLCSTSTRRLGRVGGAMLTLAGTPSGSRRATSSCASQAWGMARPLRQLIPPLDPISPPWPRSTPSSSARRPTQMTWYAHTFLGMYNVGFGFLGVPFLEFLFWEFFLGVYNEAMLAHGAILSCLRPEFGQICKKKWQKVFVIWCRCWNTQAANWDGRRASMIGLRVSFCLCILNFVCIARF